MSNIDKWSIGLIFLVAELALLIFVWSWISRPAGSPPVALPSLINTPHERAPKGVWGASSIDVERAAELHCNGAVFLDTQSPEGYARGSIPKAEWIDTRDGITRRELARHAGPEDRIVVYCENTSCWSAYRTVKTLVAWEMSNVHYLRGGLAAWNGQRHAIRTSQKGKQCKAGWNPRSRLPSL